MDHPHIQPGSRQEWRAWLKRHHAAARGVWVVYAKKHTRIPSLTWQEGVEEALCFGWIDSLRRAVDDTYFKQLYTPRKPRSTWSAINKASVERLIAAGLMTAAGLAAIELAQANGRWSALATSSHIRCPRISRPRSRETRKRAKATRDSPRSSANSSCFG